MERTRSIVAIYLQNIFAVIFKAFPRLLVLHKFCALVQAKSNGSAVSATSDQYMNTAFTLFDSLKSSSFGSVAAAIIAVESIVGIVPYAMTPVNCHWP